MSSDSWPRSLAAIRSPSRARAWSSTPPAILRACQFGACEFVSFVGIGGAQERQKAWGGEIAHWRKSRSDARRNFCGLPRDRPAWAPSLSVVVKVVVRVRFSGCSSCCSLR